MKKLLLLGCIIAAVVCSVNGQNLTQASIHRTGGLVITVYAKPTTTVNSGTNLNISFSVSLPTVTGPTSLVGSSLVGGSLTAASTETINGRKHYPFVLESPVSTVALTGNVSNPIATVTFPSSEAGDLVQMNDLTGSGTTNVYWYISYQGADGTNYVTKFYGTNPENSEFGDSKVDANAPLPITLVKFEASKMGDRSSYLTWATASEVNSSHFNIQRSLDNKTWVNIGKVNAQGNSQIIQNYEFIDQNVYNGLDSRLTTYYRLQSVDTDAKSSLSPIRTVVFTGAGTTTGRDIVVYPNPSSEGLQIEWDGSRGDQPTQLAFFDTHGKLVYATDVDENTSQQYIDFDDTTIIPGLYILRIMSGDQPIDFKQIVVDQR